MEKDNSHLKLLPGKTVTSTQYNTSIVTPINEGKTSSALIKTSLVVQLYVEDYRLDIYNLLTITPPDKQPKTKGLD